MGSFRKNITSIYGEKGKKWLADIPNIIKKYEDGWQIKIDGSYPNYYNFVAPVICKNGTKAVLKLGIPGNKEFISEMEALTFFEGRGLAKLLQYDRGGFAALIEKCEPGITLKTLKDDQKETKIAAEIMMSFWKVPPNNSIFSTTKDLGKAFIRYHKKFYDKNSPIPIKLFDKAEKIFNELILSSKDPVLLHGDMHHENILLSGRGYLAIDPKGYIGEREFEIGCFLRNPYPDFPFLRNAKSLTKNRIKLFSNILGLNKERIKLWAFAQSILSAIWVVEEKVEYLDYYLKCANLFN